MNAEFQRDLPTAEIFHTASAGEEEKLQPKMYGG